MLRQTRCCWLRSTGCTVVVMVMAASLFLLVGPTSSFQPNVKFAHRLFAKPQQHQFSLSQCLKDRPNVDVCGEMRRRHQYDAASNIVLLAAKTDDDDSTSEAEEKEPTAPPLWSWRRRLFQQRQLPTLPLSDNQPQQQQQSKPRNVRPWLSRVKISAVRWKWVRTVVTAAFMGGSALSWNPTVTLASAPVMALPKADARNPTTDAMMEHQRRMSQKAQAELRQFTEEARRIGTQQGEAARAEFEQNYKQQQEEQAQRRTREIEQLKRDLLDQGIDPFCDIEGRRQILLLEQGLDLGKVPGTPYHLEQELQRRKSPSSMAVRKKLHRQIIQSMVQDLKNRQQDPLEYFAQHQDQTASILDLPNPRAMVLLQQYQNNLEQYGQVVPPKEGELSVFELRQQQEEDEQKRQLNADPALQKKLAQEAQRQAKVAAAEERAARQLLEKQERARAKEEAQAAREQAKQEKERAKQEQIQAKQLAKAAAAAATATTAAMGKTAAAVASPEVAPEAPEVLISSESEYDTIEAESSFDQRDSSSDKLAPTKQQQSTRNFPVGKVSVGVVTVAGGAYGLYLYREKSAREEEERQRQFRLLMGTEKDNDKKKKAATRASLESNVADTPPTLKSSPQKVDGDTEPLRTEASSTEGTTVESEASKKRKLGIKGVFSKKKSERETDIGVLIRADAKAPEFARLLASILTSGAPGRFPQVVALTGNPSSTMDLESARQNLIKARVAAGLTLEESAEIFANVVNCMLIDIVDLASSSLKEKDEKATVEAIRIVVDFMNYAASLYDSVAESVTIRPVTYSGTLSKSKLEQMFSSYAGSGMLDMSQMDENFDSRVRLLQDVFQINEKKAEGLLLKAMQKSMTNMMKTGEGMEGMEAMMKTMGGDPNMAALLDGGGGANGGEGPSPEQLKELLLALKQMKESGTIPPQELETVKAQFRESFGSSIDEVMRDADVNKEAMTANDKELLDLMKSILD